MDRISSLLRGLPCSAASLTVALLMLGACSSPNLHEVYAVERSPRVGVHPLEKAGPCEDDTWLPYLSCGSHFFECEKVRPLSNESRQVVQAIANFEYAMMASNTYRHAEDYIEYVIPGWELVSRRESDTGLALEVYERRVEGELLELAIAYEGTDFGSFDDWKYNFALTRPRQFDEALEHLNAVRRANPEVPLTLTGHSLGGGMALNLSMHVPGLKAVAFNSSPRAFWGNENQKNGSRRIHMYETGEVLNLFSRTYLRARLWGSQMLPVKYNFLDFTNIMQPVPEHSMYRLSRGLMLMAIKGGDQRAVNAFAHNIGIDQAKVDPEYCPLIFGKADMPASDTSPAAGPAPVAERVDLR